MDLLAIELAKPNGLWATIIFGMEGAVKNYALALVLVTIIIKLVLVPFDFINKYTSKKSSRKQAEMKPELDKLQAKYGADKETLNRKTTQLYKSHNYNVMGTCVGMLVYLVFTMVIFWTLFGALRDISAYKIGDQFLQVRKEYFAEYGIDVDTLTEEQTALSEYNLIVEDTNKTEEELATLKTLAETAAKEKYDATKASFLWIENIWLADTTTSPVMKYSDFVKTSKVSADQISEAEYNLVIDHIKGTERKNNGFFFLAVLAAGLQYLSITVNNWISKRKALKQGVDPQLMAGGAGKFMTIIMPLIMGVFTLFYNAAFGLYIVAGALIALLTSPLVTLFVDMLEIEAIKKEQDKTVASYDRKRRK